MGTEKAELLASTMTKVECGGGLGEEEEEEVETKESTREVA